MNLDAMKKVLPRHDLSLMPQPQRVHDRDHANEATNLMGHA